MISYWRMVISYWKILILLKNLDLNLDFITTIGHAGIAALFLGRVRRVSFTSHFSSHFPLLLAHFRWKTTWKQRQIITGIGSGMSVPSSTFFATQVRFPTDFVNISWFSAVFCWFSADFRLIFMPFFATQTPTSERSTYVGMWFEEWFPI